MSSVFLFVFAACVYTATHTTCHGQLPRLHPAEKDVTSLQAPVARRLVSGVGGSSEPVGRGVGLSSERGGLRSGVGPQSQLVRGPTGSSEVRASNPLPLDQELDNAVII